MVQAQNPGGFTRWLSRVHLGNSDETNQHSKIALLNWECTVNALAICSLLSVKNRVLVLWQHLFFSRHLLVPSFDSFRRHSTILLKRHADGVDNFIN